MGHNFVPSEAWICQTHEMSFWPYDSQTTRIRLGQILKRSFIVDLFYDQMRIVFLRPPAKGTPESMTCGLQPDPQPGQFDIDFFSQKLSAIFPWKQSEVSGVKPQILQEVQGRFRQQFRI